MFTPIQQSTAWPPLLRGLGYYRRENTFQGLRGGLSLVPLITSTFFFYSVESLIAGVRKTQENIQRLFIL